MAQDHITVLGRDISYEIKNIDIYQLEYYVENPRINYILSKYPGRKNDQEFIGEKIFELDSTKELIRDLEENKGLLDEVYVVGKKVVEGNTRLCAYRWLEKKKDDPRWRKINARILHESVKDEELFYILSTFHIKGKKEWDAYEKAAYIHKMINVLKKDPVEVAKTLGKHKRSIEAMLSAYDVMSKKYLTNNDGKQNTVGAGKDELRKYSYFEAFYLQKELEKRAEDAPGFVDEFVSWVKEGRIEKAQDVRDLHKILNNKKAAKAFKDSDSETAFKDAQHVLYEHKPEQVDAFYKKVHAFKEMLEEAEPISIRKEIAENKNKKNQLQQCFKMFKKFCKEVGLDTKSIT